MTDEFLEIDQAERACMQTQDRQIFLDLHKKHYIVTNSWIDHHDLVEPIQPTRPALLCWSASIDPEFNPGISIPLVMQAALLFVEKSIGFSLPNSEFDQDSYTFNVRYPTVIVDNLQYFLNDLHLKLEKDGESILKVNRPDSNGVIRMGWIFDFAPKFMLKNDKFLIYDRNYKVSHSLQPCRAPYFKYCPNLWTNEKPLTGEKYLIFPNSKSITRLFSKEESCEVPRAVRVVLMDDTFIDIYGEQGFMNRQSGEVESLVLTDITIFKFLKLFWGLNVWRKALNKSYVQVGGDDIYNYSINERGEQDIILFKNTAFINHLKGHKYPVWEKPTKKDKEPMCILKDVAPAWLGDIERSKTKKVIFDPSRPPARTEEYLNLYQGFAVEPRAPLSGNLEDAAITIRRHIFEVLCGSNQIFYNFLLDSLASLIQNPHIKLEVVHVFKGPQGIGKNMFTDVLLEFFGNHGIEITQQRQFLGHFNQHMFNKILVILNEAFWGGDKQSEGALKAMITEKKANYEPKGKNLTEGSNYQNHIILSNENWCVPVDTDDRRYCVYPVSAHRKGDTEYFTLLANCEEKEEFFWYLKNRIIPLNWRAADHLPPRNREFVLQITQNRSQAPLKFFLDVFEDQGCWPPYIREGEAVMSSPQSVWLALKQQGAQVLGLEKYLVSQTSTTQMLRQIFGDCFDNRAREGQNTSRLYRFANAETCKQRLLNYIKCPTYFDNDDQEPDLKKSKI